MKMNQLGLGRKLALVLGSFFVIAITLVVYFHAPVLAVLGGGLLAIVITILKHLSTK